MVYVRSIFSQRAQAIGNGHHGHQDEGEGGGEREIAATADLHHDELGHEQFVVAAQNLRRDVIADGQNEGQKCPTMTPGMVSGKII
jgi:hypothetical protein